MEETPKGDFAATAQGNLAIYEDEYQNFVAKIQQLYAKINEMNTFGNYLTDEKEKNTAFRLAGELKQDLDYFLSLHVITPPDRISFNQFKAKFNARLHSEDVVMSQHEGWWQSFTQGIKEAFAAIGSALGIQSSHATRISLFATGTHKQENINKIEAALGEVDLPEKDSTAPEPP